MEEAIRQIIEDIWRSVVGLEAGAAAGTPLPQGSWTAAVRLTGAWNGAVIIQCSGALARRSAAAMFAVRPEATSDDMIRDALGELTNMAAGNIKALLPEPCKLSLPSAEPGVPSPAGMPTARVALEIEGEPLAVVLVEESRIRNREAR